MVGVSGGHRRCGAEEPGGCARSHQHNRGFTSGVAVLAWLRWHLAGTAWSSGGSLSRDGAWQKRIPKSLLGHLQEPPGHGNELPARGGPAGAKLGAEGPAQEVPSTSAIVWFWEEQRTPKMSPPQRMDNSPHIPVAWRRLGRGSLSWRAARPTHGLGI